MTPVVEAAGLFGHLKTRLARRMPKLVRAFIMALIALLLVAAQGETVKAALYATASPNGRRVLHIVDDLGGSMNNHIAFFSAVRQNRDMIEIEGLCMSACTMLLGIVPPQDVCTRPGVVFGFHAARDADYADDGFIVSQTGTALLMSYYPQPIRDWIRHQGGLNSEMLLLSGRELERYVRPCPRNQWRSQRVS